MYVFVHGLGVSSDIWNPLKNVIEGKNRCLMYDLPGHGSSNSLKFDFSEIYSDLVSKIPSKNENVTLVLHSFSAALLPQIIDNNFPLEKIFIVEGVLFREDASWTSRPVFYDDTLYHEWLKRFRLVSEMTLKSQLYKKHEKMNLVFWSNGFKVVDGTALREMAKNLISLLSTSQIEEALRKCHIPITFLKGEHTRLSKKGFEKLIRMGFDVVSIKGSGHFPMLDNPIELSDAICFY